MYSLAQSQQVALRKEEEGGGGVGGGVVCERDEDGTNHPKNNSSRQPSAGMQELRLVTHNTSANPTTKVDLSAKVRRGNRKGKRDERKGKGTLMESSRAASSPGETIRKKEGAPEASTPLASGTTTTTLLSNDNKARRERSTRNSIADLESGRVKTHGSRRKQEVEHSSNNHHHDVMDELQPPGAVRVSGTAIGFGGGNNSDDDDFDDDDDGDSEVVVSSSAAEAHRRPEMLIEAMTVKEVPLVHADQTVNVEKALQNQQSKQRRRLLVMGVIAVAAVLIGVGLGVGLGLRGGGGGDATVQVVSISDAPSGSPSHAPTFSNDGVVEFLSKISFDNGAALNDPSSPQFQALQWIQDVRFNPSLTQSTTTIQRYVLAVLYFATNGDEWSANTNWLSESHICEWFTTGIRSDICSPDLTLRHLDLNRNNLAGSIPEEVGLLDDLTILDLSFNVLTGTIPSEVQLFLGDVRKSMASETFYAQTMKEEEDHDEEDENEEVVVGAGEDDDNSSCPYYSHELIEDSQESSEIVLALLEKVKRKSICSNPGSGLHDNTNNHHDSSSSSSSLSSSLSWRRRQQEQRRKEMR